MANKEWKRLQEAAFYRISSDGEIYNIKRKRKLKLTKRYEKNGRPRRVDVTLSTFNGSKEFRVHKLVMKYFGCPPPTSKTKVSIDHKDRNPFNNKINNLRWASGKEQAANKMIVKPKIKFTADEINTFYLQSQSRSLSSIAKEIGIDRGNLWAILKYVHPEY